MRYHWDKAKSRTNFRKHGIAFEDAIHVFDDACLIWPDERFEYGETRWIAIGFGSGEEIVVVYTEEGEERRIISARRATRKERALYWNWRS